MNDEEVYLMTNALSDWAREFLREDHVGMVGTLNADGSPHLTTMWYLLADDDMLIKNSVRFLHLSTNAWRNSLHSNPSSRAKAKTVAGREEWRCARDGDEWRLLSHRSMNGQFECHGG